MGVAMPKFLDVKLYLLYNLRGLLGPWPRPFSKNFSGVMSRLSLGTCLPNLKSVALNVLVLDSGSVTTQNRWTQVRGPEHSRRQSLI